MLRFFGALFLLFIPLPLALARWNPYCLRCAMGIDMWLSLMTNGRPGETLSGRCGSSYLQGKRKAKFWRPVINFIMGSPTHCVDAIQGDRLRAQAVLADDAPYGYKPQA